MLSLLQQVDIEEKIQNAPNNSYKIEVLTGTILAVIDLIILAYATFRQKKEPLKQ